MSLETTYTISQYIFEKNENKSIEISSTQVSKDKNIFFNIISEKTDESIFYLKYSIDLNKKEITIYDADCDFEKIFLLINVYKFLKNI